MGGRRNPRRKDFYFSFCQAPWSIGHGCFCDVCALPMYNTSVHTYVGLVSRPSGWSEKSASRGFLFFLFAKIPGQRGLLFLCCLRIANVQCKCTHVRRTCVTTQWVVGEIRVADFCFFLLPSSLVDGAMLFLCCLRIANVQCKCTHVRRTCVTTQWVVGEIRAARIFIFFFLPRFLVNGAMLFLCCLRIANVQHKCTHVRRTCVTTQWVAGEIRVARIFIFSFCQAPWSMGQCCFCVVCALPMYNTSAHTYVGLVSRPSGW